MKELGTMPYVAAGFGLFFLFALIFEPVMPFFLLSVFLLIAAIIIYDTGTGTPKQQYTIRDSSASHSTGDHLAKMFNKAVATSRTTQQPYTAPQKKDDSSKPDKKDNNQAAPPSSAVMVIIGLLAVWLMVS